MREILFRGKRLNNGEWVYGYLMKGFGVLEIQPEQDENTIYAIAPETVGQFTGLTDKNGKNIFEGDIVKDDWGKVYEVFYTTTSCSFVVKCPNPPNEWEKGNYRLGEAWCTTIRVIGNIHDNPELLKGE